MWARPCSAAVPEQRPERLEVGEVRREQRLAHGLPLAAPGGAGRRCRQAALLEEDLAGERVAVGVQAGRGEADQDVARRAPGSRRARFGRSTTPTMKPTSS